MTCPPAPFQHLLRMTDEIGLFEHADGIVPRYEHGYCVDDVARGLVVVCRELEPSAELTEVAARYLTFLAQAQSPSGRSRNRLGLDRRWHDQPGTEDCWGRALWGMGTAAARGAGADLRSIALALFGCGAQARSPWPHAMAFAALGAAEVLDTEPGHSGALSLLADVVTVIGDPSPDAAWPWPAPRLSYASGVIAEAVIIAGTQLGQDGVLHRGLAMLEWLVEAETSGGHLSVVPVGGRGPGDPRPGFDQQPIEVAALADACMRAAAVTGDSSWLTVVGRCVAWFLGDNDRQVPLLDEATGGGCDGLTAEGRNINQGAESTIAMISVLQHGRQLIAAGR
ncbi:MAG: glycosyltransferase [Actinomycetota bacterium]